ncbi:response regulator [Paraburkholderia sp. SIMBA_055]|jgi:two-component system chemotaxis response regulator CheY|uniref:Response regulator receiver protein n=2 Tax=Paraburkholderia graminis TaxID=60548 RepID=B1G4F0_PARG4|nr:MULTISPECIES: response regulator [Paraburkholderia]ALE56253.1 chemotaxis protein CheY [Burkholderia sp. HB1]AXF09493.1 response regulator [Paraburkholderia graminis]EDT08965.1 response regulator receiver protein [Paraburkholderia graminis C4D1M]MDQ0621124.1 two-component system chemotaxis response regulator CheY [Paraburkholderia graminis]MDR6202217.1 two-component system chemotaxis response regulator CheY [Paraburkholderia graminis]
MIRHILAIDDSASMRQILSATLTAAGYEVTLAADGAEGLENALAVRFDLVLTDQHMPGKTGLDLIAELRGNPAYADTPILVLTTESGEPFKAAAREAGATGWIEKPLDPELLTELVAALAEPDHA